MSSHTELVKKFTEESMGVTLPTRPQPMEEKDVRFIVRMVLSEMLELCCTVTDNEHEAREMLIECVGGVDHPSKFPVKEPVENLIAEQYDAFVDAWYYMLNTSVKKGVDLDKLFHLVHEANMRKRWEDGTFHRRGDGKVMKPQGWTEPDLVSEIKRQLQ
jgi:predicted HAD superfamily Cof-like phosphohydrolase